VAEIGQNHQGDVYTAVRLCLAANEAGVDAVKFCKRDIDSDLTAAAANEPYNGPQSFGATYGEHRRKLELTPEMYGRLKERIAYNSWPQLMFATACDIKSVRDLEASIDPPLYKVASRDIDNEPLLKAIAATGKPVVLSSGLGTKEDIGAAIETIRQQHDQIVLLQCRSDYPTENRNVGLSRISEYAEYFAVLTGLSDHTAGIVMAQAAAAMGAVMVEKHITLARGMQGTDHACSLEPDGIKRLVRNIRAVEEAKQEPEATRPISAIKLGRSLVAAKEITKGATISESDLCLKSPGTGFSWGRRDEVIGRVARNTIPANVTIRLDDLE
jgi:sialic acid synthase SpsE